MEGSFVVVNQGENCGINNNIDTNTTSQAMEQLDLPPGFRFHPTDEEIVNHYLIPKVINSNFTAISMAEVDLNRNEPWDLPSKQIFYLLNLYIMLFYFFGFKYLDYVFVKKWSIYSIIKV